MKTYLEIIEEFHQKPFTNDESIFDYHNTPFEKEFEDMFTFYQETLYLNRHYGITPSRLYFNTTYGVNARAVKAPDFYLISIKAGLLLKMIEMFKNNSNFLIKAGQKMKLIEDYFDVSTQELMYQLAIHFTFYHEMAHLIQKSEFLDSGLNENLDGTVVFSSRRHLLELDADEFSAVSIAAHTVQYASNIFGDDISSSNKKIEELLVLVCSTVLLYMLTFSSNNKEIYYKESSHPHPVIRVLRVMNTIIGQYQQTFNHLGVSIKIDLPDIIRRSAEFAGEIAEDIIGENPTERFVAYLATEMDNIKQYLKEFDELGAGDETLALNKWNAYARTLHG